MINTQEQYDNDDKQYARFIRFLKENNVFLTWKERVMKRNNLEPSFNIEKWFNFLNFKRNESIEKGFIEKDYRLDQFEFAVMARMPTQKFFILMKDEDDILYNIKDKGYTILNTSKEDTNSSSDS